MGLLVLVLDDDGGMGPASSRSSSSASEAARLSMPLMEPPPSRPRWSWARLGRARGLAVFVLVGSSVWRGFFELDVLDVLVDGGLGLDVVDVVEVVEVEVGGSVFVVSGCTSWLLWL